ncbi:MAG: SusF/SusE family outer membrane protein [Prevotella sp.]|nr:SusF/SusE family outer membrane protein [Prevotella sp.]MDD6753714.1 SusF/SusE family outer membrane protein [Prevotella sp.]MDY3272023.1 SusF/SusE family outer membrane protein [Prevotella sp.]
MKTKTFTQRLLGCMLLAASTLTVQAAERLLIVGDGVWGGWSIDNSIVMMNDAAQPDVFTATVSLKANSDFKFLTETEWGKLEYRAGDAGVTLSDGVSAALVSSDDNSNDNKFQVGETANYSIVCDLAAKTVTVTKAAYQDDEIKHTALWLVGSATTGGWDLGKATMILPSDDNPMVFRGTVDLLEGEMKIAVNKYTGYGQTFYQRDAADDTKMTFGGDDNKWNISKAGQYDVEADVKNLTISIKEHTSTGITNMATTATATAEYFTLSGVRLSAPAKGICVKRLGNRVVKTINRK